MKSIFFFLALSFLMLNVNAKPLSIEVKTELTQSVGNITGVIVGPDGMGIANATVELLDENGKLVDSTFSEGDGSFMIENKAYGKYILKITVGSAPPYEQIVNINSDSTDLGQIHLNSAAVQLGTTEARAEVSKIRTEIDKRVVEVGQDLVSAGATAGEVLNNIPSLNVDQQSGALSLRGNSSVRVFVDGKPSSLPIDQLLRSLPSNSIDKVEIITNPSAKYDPDGNSGIINIITIKEKRKGYNVSTTLGYTRGAHNRYNASVNGNLNTGNVNIFGNYSTNLGKSNMAGYMNNYDLDIRQDFRLPSERTSHRVKAGLDWFINDKTAMTVYTNQNVGNMEMDNTSLLMYPGLSTALVDRSLYNYDNTGSDYSLNFSRDFEKEGHKIEFDGFYSRSNWEGASDFNWQSAVRGVEDQELAASLRAYEQLQESGFDFSRFKLDYTLPVLEKGKIETGLQYQTDATESSLGNTQLLPVYTEGVLTDAFQAQDIYFDFQRNIFASYLNLGYQWEKIGMQLGLRHEFVNEDLLTALTGSADIPDNRDNLNRDNSNLYPSAFFTFQATENDQFSLNYSRRVDRPGAWQLSPVRQWQTATARQEGNPDLKPQFTDSYELGYMRTVGKKGNINASLFYRKIHDQISRLFYLDEINPEILIERSANVDDTESAGAELSWFLKNNNWWSMNGGLDLYRSKLKGFISDNTEIEKNSTIFTGRLSNDFSLSEKLKLQLFTMYMGERIQLQGVSKPMFRQDIGLRYSFAEGKGTLSTKLSDIFNTFYAHSVNDMPLRQEGIFRWESRTFYLGLTYNFGGKVKTRADKQRNQSDVGQPGMGF